MKIAGRLLVAIVLVLALAVSAVAGFRPDILSFSLSVGPFASVCTRGNQIAPRDRAAIERSTREFVAYLLSGASEDAFEAMSSAAQRNVSREEVATMAAHLRSMAAASEPAVTQIYLVRSAGFRSGAKAPCGPAPNVDFVAIGEAIDSAHVLLIDDLPGAQRTWSVWLERAGGVWRVARFYAGPSQLAGRSGADFLAAAREQRAKEHVFNAGMLYRAAQMGSYRGPYFEPAHARALEDDLATFRQPVELTQRAPFTWTLNRRAFTILGIDYMGVADGTLALLITQPWPDTEGDRDAVRRNHELIDAFIAAHPEWTEAADGVIARSIRSDSSRYYQTVYKKVGGYVSRDQRVR